MLFIANVQQTFQFFRPVKREDFSAARVRIEPVGESSDDTSGFVAKWKRQPVVGDTVGQTFGVLVGLGFDPREVCAFLFGFDDSSNFTVDIETVVGFPSGQRKLAHSNAKSSHDVHAGEVLNNPTAGFQLAVDIFAGFVFWGSQWNDKKLEQKTG